ncbi:luciferase-like monooxygenase [Gluconobacter cerinus NRIC 0229]|nr:luciferase-like monooxygenase [Gluconobacter cerinus NRIC 0229]
MGLRVPVWILGSSLFSAVLAAQLGLPYAFASHFAPAQMEEAIALYRSRFEPSERCARPHVMLTVNVIAADEEADGKRLATSLYQYFMALRRGRPIAFPPPVNNILSLWSVEEQALLEQTLAYTFSGSRESVTGQLRHFLERHKPDELMVAVPIHDQDSRKRSLEITARIKADVGA